MCPPLLCAPPRKYDRSKGENLRQLLRLAYEECVATVADVPAGGVGAT
jgi:hypothetical protein